MLSVASSYHYNGNSKNDKNCLQTNAHPSGAIPTNFHPLPSRQKLGCTAPGWGTNFWCKSPEVHGEGDGYG